MKRRSRKKLKKRRYWSYFWRSLLLCLPILISIMTYNVFEVRDCQKANFPEGTKFSRLAAPPISSWWLGLFAPADFESGTIENMLTGKDEKQYTFDDTKLKKINQVLASMSECAEENIHKNTAYAMAVDEWKYDEKNKKYYLENVLFSTSDEINYVFFKDDKKTELINCLTEIPYEWKDKISTVDGDSLKNGLFNKMQYLIDFDDVYIKDNTCRIGKYRLYSYESKTDKTTLIEECDDTPENADEYTHIFKKERDSLSELGEAPAILWLNMLGTSPDCENLKKLKSLKNGNEPLGDKLYDMALSHDGSWEISQGGFRMPESEIQLTEDTEWDGYKYEVTLLGICDEPDVFSGFFVKNIFLPVMLDWILILVIASALFSGHFFCRYSRLYRNQQKADYRRTLTNTLAHDLKLPLTAAQGYAENLRENTNPEKNDYYLDRIVENIQYTNQIISDVLELAKIEENDAEPICEKLDVSAILRQKLESFGEDFERRGIKLNLSDKPLLMNINEPMFRQMAVNLTDNILRYTTDNGSVFLEIEGNSLVLRNSCDKNIKLSGKELMQPLVKDDKSRSERNGSGIGLAIVQRLAECQKIKLSVSVENGFFTVIAMKR